ncbi:MAG: tRNA uridine-5-carboxymethylaminomethyl(34) synthesis GTPase MnmE [Bacteroidetes bacterium]|jgi:tRNA modification GTPase|nr:tRNA uridine-5-carboxymethylaminomethyl(34) synthesis GTPase MnmE [Bacteroidota bacterium]
MKPSIDTIVAIATPPGEGGIAVLRVSGPEAVAIVDRRFRAPTPLASAASHTAHVGAICDAAGERIDQVVCTVFRAPHSYTGEDVVEVSCHGGTLTSRRVMGVLLETGAEMARPGEFTKRAFLNGKMDLAQAEAVAELIHARSDAARRISLEQLAGRLSSEVQTLRRSLMDAVGLLELELDFAEDGYEFLDRSKIRELLNDAGSSLRRLLESYRAGKVFRDGVKLVLTGAPNAGKSSLLNALLKESRAIVTEVPGTTRDVIEEGLSIGGVLFRVVDTAGLRPTSDPVEREGVERAHEQLRSADVVIWVVDLMAPIQPTKEAIESIGSSHVIVALNKSDVIARSSSTRMDIEDDSRALRISAKTGDGIQRLEEEMLAVAVGRTPSDNTEGATVTNARHYDVLRRASRSLTLALESLEGGKTGEFLALDIREALNTLAELTGEVTTDDIMNAVFSKFCIGK